MGRLKVFGGNRLEGEVTVQGAKNSALVLIAASFLCRGRVNLHNCPDLSDVRFSFEILKSLGAGVDYSGGVAAITEAPEPGCEISDYLMRQMRSSVVFLGAIIAKAGKAVITRPGGCALGPRPIDIHLEGLKKLGVRVDDSGGHVVCTVDREIVGADITLKMPSVGATENLMITAAIARGDTTINNAAKEPEIVELANFLNSCGAFIKGAGSDKIHIKGVKKLHGCDYRIMPDRIAASTIMAGVAAAGGEVYVRDAVKADMEAVLSVFEEAGARIYSGAQGIYFRSKVRPKAVKDLITMPFPGFPTDAQPLIGALMAFSDGTTTIKETIFENRFSYADQLARMGADIRVYGRFAVIEGREILYGAQTEVKDLRGGAATVVAALGARGETVIHNTELIDRGYVRIEEAFNTLGGLITRED